MKRSFAIFICVLAFFTAILFFPSPTRADVAVRMVFTQKPTPQFKNFVVEFVLALSQCFQEAEPAIQCKAAGVEAKTFFLVERRRGKKLWQVGLCKLKDNLQPALKLSSDAVFCPLWQIEGKKLKDKGNIRALAREAASFLFNYLQKEEV